MSAMPPSAGLTIKVLESSEMEVEDKVRSFLNKELPANVSGLAPESKHGETRHLEATVFMDFIPLSIDICIFSPNGVDETAVVLLDLSQGDVICFNRFVERLTTFLMSTGLRIVAPHHGAAGIRTGLVDDDFGDMQDDMSTDDHLSWPERVELVLADVNSPNAAVREEAFQCLARWAVSAPSSREEVANGLAKHGAKLFANPLSSLAETYPVASALRAMTCGTSPGACKIISNSNLFTALRTMKVSEFPPLVAHELLMTAQNLQVPHKVLAGPDFQKDDSLGDKFTSNSTKFASTDLESLTDDDY